MLEYLSKRGDYMELSSKEIDIVMALIHYGKEIYEQYSSIISNGLKEENIKTLKLDLDFEQDFLDELELNPQKAEAIKAHINSIIPLEYDQELLVGTSPHINENTYPYYRAYARVAYTAYEKSDKSPDMVRNAYFDARVGLLYRSLLDEAKENKPCANNMVEYAFLILMDSPKAERQALERHFYPSEHVDDLTTFAIDLELISLIKKFFPEGQPVQTASNRANVIYKEHCRKIVNKIDEMLKKQFDESNPLDSSNSSLVLYMCELKSAIALLGKKDREKIYASLLRDQFMTSKIDREYLKKTFISVESKLVPSIRTLSLGKPHQK